MLYSYKAIKLEGGHAEHHMNDVEVTCLPGNLPEYIEVDMTEVEAGVTLHLSDLQLPKGVASTQLAMDHDLPIAGVKKPGGPAASEEGEDADSAE